MFSGEDGGLERSNSKEIRFLLLSNIKQNAIKNVTLPMTIQLLRLHCEGDCLLLWQRVVPYDGRVDDPHPTHLHHLLRRHVFKLHLQQVVHQKGSRKGLQR